MADYQKPSIINPVLTIGTMSSDLAETIFDGLIRRDENLEVKPHLALSWEILDNGMRWRFYLRRGIFFHDKIELTSRDVGFTFERVKDPRYKGLFFYLFQDVKEVIERDRYTIDIILTRPNASFINNLSVGILPRDLLEKEDLLTTKFNYHPIGTGPFKIVRWEEGEIALEANRDYFLGRPYLDKVLLKIYPNMEGAWAGLIRGDTDYFPDLTPENFNILKKIPGLKTYSYLKPFYYILAFNLRNEIFKDEKIRQALNYAVDKDKIIKEVLKGEGMIAKGPIYPGSSWAYDKEISLYPYDPQKALNLLKEAGWIDHNGDHILDRNGKDLEFTLHINKGDNIKEKTALMIQGQFLDLGIMMKVKIFNAASLDFLYEKRFDAYFPEILAAGDPDIGYRYWHSSQIKDGLNFSSYKNQEIDRLLDQGRSTEDIKERKAIYYRFQEEILDDPPGIFLFWSNYLVGVHKRFKGVKITAAGPFSNIREWYVPKEEQREKRDYIKAVK